MRYEDNSCRMFAVEPLLRETLILFSTAISWNSCLRFPGPLLRPGQRRSLMKRALRGIVPDEILDRRRRAFLVRAPWGSFVRSRPRSSGLEQGQLSAKLRIIDARLFRESIEAACHGEEVHTPALFRTIVLEIWLRNLERHATVLV